MTKNIRLIVSYQGTDFLGWQKTPLGKTVEGSLETALNQILNEKVKLQAAGRTDAGVHAEGQSVNFFTTKKNLSLPKLQLGLNALLPPSIAVLHIEEKPLSFHPTLDSEGKEYRYLICNGPYQLPKHRFFSWHVPKDLNENLIREAATELIGTRDFSAFCNELPVNQKNPICTLHAIEIRKIEPDRWQFSIIGDRFLYKMVRNLTGTLVYVGTGKIKPSQIKEILSNKKRALAGVTAPAHGLHLFRVFYKKTENGTLFVN